MIAAFCYSQVTATRTRASNKRNAKTEPCADATWNETCTRSPLPQANYHLSTMTNVLGRSVMIRHAHG